MVECGSGRVVVSLQGLRLPAAAPSDLELGLLQLFFLLESLHVVHKREEIVIRITESLCTEVAGILLKLRHIACVLFGGQDGAFEAVELRLADD